jgi:hypothetical protein
VNGKGGLGYNSERFFGGFEINAFRSFKDDSSPSVSLVTTYNALQFFAGYRFNAPKKVKELAQKVESKIKL